MGSYWIKELEGRIHNTHCTHLFIYICMCISIANRTHADRQRRLNGNVICRCHFLQSDNESMFAHTVARIVREKSTSPPTLFLSFFLFFVSVFVFFSFFLHRSNAGAHMCTTEVAERLCVIPSLIVLERLLCPCSGHWKAATTSPKWLLPTITY